MSKSNETVAVRYALEIDLVISQFYFDEPLVTGKSNFHLQNIVLFNVTGFVFKCYPSRRCTPPHSTRTMRELLDTKSPNARIVRGGLINYPACFTDLSSVPLFERIREN